jgi:hypothetical protein
MRPEPLTPPASLDEQRRQVQVALHPRLIGGYLVEALGPGQAGGACHVLDAQYRPGERCTVLYQLDGRLVVGLLAWGEGADEVSGLARAIPPLGMRAYLFPHDPALPGLGPALQPRAMARALAESLPACRMGAERLLRCRVTPLRYRPGRRCTLRFDVWLRETRTGTIAARMLVGKVYHDPAKAVAVYRVMRALADAAPVREGRIEVAGPVAFLPALGIVLQEPIVGTALDLLLGGAGAAGGDPRGARGVARAAAALAALHLSGLVAERERPAAAELDTLERRARQIALVDAGLGARMSALVGSLRAWGEHLPGRGAERTLVHGDCKPSQFLLNGERIALLDFDHCGMGDPAADVGTFLATLRQMAVGEALAARSTAAAAARGRWLWALERRFVEAYCAASGFGPDFGGRVTWYQALALLRKAQRGFARAPRSPLPAALVEEARVLYAHG